MKKIIYTLVFMVISSNVYAGFAAGLDVWRIRVHTSNVVLFGSQTQPANTCNNWGEYFIFDQTTDAGKSLLSTLLTAKASGKLVTVWYADSPTAGTDHTNGCTNNTTAIVTGIAFN